MNSIDIVLLVPILIAVVIGIKNGFFVELASIAGILLGFYLADKLTVFVIDICDITWKYAFETCYILLIILTMFLLWILAKILTNLFSAICLGVINRLAGAIIGGAKAILILSLLVTLFNSINLKKEIVAKSTIKESYLYDRMLNTADYIYPYLENSIDKTVDYIKEKIDG